MARYFPIIITSIIVVTLFVLLVYPAIFPVNAPPVLKTFKDIFIAILVAVFVITAAEFLAESSEPVQFVATPSYDSCSLLCTLRC